MRSSNKIHFNQFKTKRDKSLSNKLKKEILAESIDIVCYWCKCFLDQSTAILLMKAKNSFYTTFKVIPLCYECKNNIIPKAPYTLPKRTKNGRFINW